MRTFTLRLLALALTLGGTLSLSAQTRGAPVAAGATPPSAEANEALRALAKLFFEVKPLDPHAIKEGTFDFIARYPEDPRLASPLRAVSGLENNFAGEERAAFRADVDRRLAALLERDDLPAPAWEAVMLTVITRLSEQENVDLAAIRHHADRLAARVPNARFQAMVETTYVDQLEKTDPEAAWAHLESLVASPHRGVANMARSGLVIRTAQREPLDLAFTTLDGRAFDISELHGKVVLIDFWATWCGPCLAELPNIQNVYAKYRDQGFEIISISLDQARAEPLLRSMIEEKNMTWIHHFDGRGWQNEIGQRFAINAIPAMFLLDRTGRIAATNARGERLEPLVQALLAR
jgi:thiol-disulfide isomerase/thioredoxin